MSDRNKVNLWLKSRPTGSDVTPELKHWLRLLRLALIAFAVVLAGVAACGLSIYATNRAEGAAPGDCERVIALVFVHNSAGRVNIRPVPAVTGTALRVVSSAQNPHEAIGKSGDGKWWQLCETKDGEEWITANETWTIGVSVTPGPTRATNTAVPTKAATTAPNTPTRIITNTSIPAADRTQTAKQYAEEICWLPPGAPADSRGVCSTYPFGSRFSWRTIQVQP